MSSQSRTIAALIVWAALIAARPMPMVAARGESPAAFDGRSIPPLGVARRLNIPDIRPPRALIVGRLARLGASRPFHHGLLGAPVSAAARQR